MPSRYYFFVSVSPGSCLLPCRDFIGPPRRVAASGPVVRLRTAGGLTAGAVGSLLGSASVRFTTIYSWYWMLLENRSGELIGAWRIDRALISAVRRSSVIFIMCVGFWRSLSQSFCLESNSPSVCPSNTTNRDGFVIFYSY